MDHPDSPHGPGLREIRLPPGPDFLDQCARHVIDAAGVFLPDLSSLVVVLPNQHIAPAFRRALARAAARALWMPRLNTLTGLLREPLAQLPKDSEAARRLRLYEVLSQQSMFKSLGLWELADELGQLFDELTERQAIMPPDAKALADRLAAGYGVEAGASLSLEAQFVHLLWQADSEGLPSLAAALQQAFQVFAERHPAGVPVFFMGDGQLSPKERRFIESVSARSPVHLFVPDRGNAPENALLATLCAAWPVEDAAVPVFERARALRARHQDFSLASRVQFMAARSLENEASAVAERIRSRWVAGAKSIALIAVDRVAARRARAALAALGIEVQDETGWLLSTTRAAALIDAVLELVASNAYHRAVLDLAKVPFVCADLDSDARFEAVLKLEQVIARHNFVSSMKGLSRLVERDPRWHPARALVGRLAEAFAVLSQRPASIADWIQRLMSVLDTLGARAALHDDPAGQAVISLLEARSAELAGKGVRVSLTDWRDWLNREFERSMFRDDEISSEVVITHLAAARLRQFDCAVVVGADRAHLEASSGSAIFANESVRRELGLGTRCEARERLREDLALLIAHCGDVLFTRQAMRGDEPNLDSPELEMLQMLHQSAFGDDLERLPSPDPVRGNAQGLSIQRMPAPTLPAGAVPTRLSASGYGSLVACPYQYFARQVLGLGEQDEVIEALEKRDYGEAVHDILHRFHLTHGPLLAHDETALVRSLTQMTHEQFADAVRENFLEQAWLVRWLSRVPAYVAWAREREQLGWQWVEGERKLERELALQGAASVTLHGRIDRLDKRAEGVALLDYKTQSSKALMDKVQDIEFDVQLPFYSLLHTGAVREAAYVALDDADGVKTVVLQNVGAAAEQHSQRIRAVFSDLHEGAAMPAHGVGAACQWCEMQGVCRKGYHTS